MLAAGASIGQIFEAGMLICFGISWPIDILKTVRVRRTEGKSLAFMAIIAIGYCSGIVAKFHRAAENGSRLEAVIWLYAINLLLVIVDLIITIYFRSAAAPEIASIDP